MDSLINKRVLRCERHFHDSLDEYVNDSLDDYQQELDGDVFLTFDDESEIRFFAITEEFSIGYDLQFDSGLKNDSVDLSTNSFWKTKLKKSITKVELLYSEFRSNPYGIKFHLENSDSFSVIYVSDSDYTFDAIVLR